MIRHYIKFITLCFLVTNTYALKLADFSSGFIASGTTESSDLTLPVKPLVTTKRDNSKHRSWYCNRTQSKSNVFCKENESGTAARVITYADGDGDDKSKVVDVSSGAAQSTANQSSLLDQSTKNEIYKYNNNFTLPIKPSENIDMDVGPNRVGVNIKY
jgi:hypothetical protein